MLTGLKVPSLAGNGPEHNAKGRIMELNFEGIEMLKMKYNNGENPDRK